MVGAPDLLVQTHWEGLVGGVLYSLIALGFVLIFKASGVFNFAQGIMMVFAALTLVGLHEKGVPAFVALGLTIVVMFALALAVERVILRPLVNQPDIILFMATFGLTYLLIGLGELVFGGSPKSMITSQLLLPSGSLDFKILGGLVSLQKIDIAAAIIASLMVAVLAVFFQKTRIGRALRAVEDDHQAALSVGISLDQIRVIVWFTAGLVALATGIMWGARSDVSFALEIVALKALPVLILGGLTSVPGAIVGGLIIGIGEKLGEFYWGPLIGGGIGLNILTGHTGLVSLGTGAFMGVGAYACYELSTAFPAINILVWIVASGFVSCSVGVLFGLPSLRIKGFYLAVATLAAQFFLQWCFVRIPWLYNYNPSGAIEVPSRTLFGLHVTGASATPTTRYYIALAIVIGVTWIVST